MLRTLLAAGSQPAPGTARPDRQGHIRMSTAPAKTPRLVPELRPTAALQLYLETIIYKTRERLELINITRDLNEVVRKQDRKSTRLNSSHGYISYAVFCLKKKKNKET